MKEKKLSEFLKENGAYESFIENCLNDEGTVENIKSNELKGVGISNGFTWSETSQGLEYWQKLYLKLRNGITNDMDEILYKEYEKRNMKESSEQNPITKDIVEGFEYPIFGLNLTEGYIVRFDGYCRGEVLMEGDYKNPNKRLYSVNWLPHSDTTVWRILTEQEALDLINRSKDIVENNAEITKQEFQTITLNGIEYNLIPKEISVGYIANWQDKDTKVETAEDYLKRKFNEGNGQYEVLFKEKKSKDWSFCYRPNDLSWRKDFDYKLIKKEHKEIVEAYLKDSSIKIQFRWYVEDWEILDNLIENYDEDFCYRIAKKEFEPFTLNIEVKTLDEAKSLWNRFNLNYSTLCEAIQSKSYNVEFKNRINSHKYWKQLDNILKDLGEEPNATELYETNNV